MCPCALFYNVSLCSLVLLVFLNVMLFYKLWMLEYSAQSLTSWQGLRLHERYNTYYNCFTPTTILSQDPPTHDVIKLHPQQYKSPPSIMSSHTQNSIEPHPQLLSFSTTPRPTHNYIDLHPKQYTVELHWQSHATSTTVLSHAHNYELLPQHQDPPTIVMSCTHNVKSHLQQYFAMPTVVRSSHNIKTHSLYCRAFVWNAQIELRHSAFV